MRDETVLVLILVLKDLLHQLVVLSQHVLQLLGILSLHGGHLLL